MFNKTTLAGILHKKSASYEALFEESFSQVLSHLGVTILRDANFLTRKN